MKEQIKKMKEELKGLAQLIKESKPEYKQSQRECSLASNTGIDYKQLKPYWDKVYSKGSSLGSAQYEFRHKHIAYCLLRGKTLIQIENTERCANERGNCYMCNHPNMKYVDSLVKEAQDVAAANGQNQEVAG